LRFAMCGFGSGKLRQPVRRRQHHSICRRVRTAPQVEGSWGKLACGPTLAVSSLDSSRSTSRLSPICASDGNCQWVALPILIPEQCSSGVIPDRRPQDRSGGSCTPQVTAVPRLTSTGYHIRNCCTVLHGSLKLLVIGKDWLERSQSA
jgi:hypothetical protein